MSVGSKKPSPSRDAAVCLGLVVAALIAFFPAFSLGFLTYDDPLYVTDNPYVNQGLTRDAIVHAFTGTYVANWQPLTGLSHVLDVQLFGLNPAAHHAVSILIHAANVVLLFLFLRRTTREAGPSAVVALVFAVHPLRVESVAWIAERKDVLSTFFWFLGLLLYANYVHQRSTRRYLAVCAALVCGLLAKSMLVTFPFLLLVLDVWPLRRLDLAQPAREVWKTALSLVGEKIPMFAAIVIFAVIAFLTQRDANAVGSGESYPIAARVLNALDAYGQYAWRHVMPIGQSIFYPFKGDVSVVLPGAVAGLLFIAVMSGVAWRVRKTAPYVLAGWCWYLGTLVPVIGLVKIGGQAMADRYTYVPGVGLLIVAVWGLAALMAKRSIPKQVQMISIGVLSILFVAMTWHYLSFWRDSETLYRRALAVTTGNYPASVNLGNILVTRGQPEDLAEAKLLFESAVDAVPTGAEALKNLGIVSGMQGDPATAIAYFDRALQVTPSDSDLHALKISTQVKSGHLDDARRSLNEALSLFPDNPRFHAMVQRLAAPST